MISGDRCSYWQSEYMAPATRLDATWVADLGDGVSRLSVLLPTAERTVVEAAQCEPVDQTAGCWSVMPT
jgi:hypothetical protein